MSYNYEININNSKKKKHSSKYLYDNNMVDSQTYVFELIIINDMNENQIIRKIKRNNMGVLISSDELVSYNNIDSYILTVIDLNNPEKMIVVKEMFNNNLSTNIFLNDMIYLQIVQEENYTNINYMIL